MKLMLWEESVLLFLEMKDTLRQGNIKIIHLFIYL